MVVLKRAMKDGMQGGLAAAQTLITNNPATQPLLDLLPKDGPLPTIQQLEQKASVQLQISLTMLANQCKAAKCQPLEVFTRSMQRTTHKAGVDIIGMEFRPKDRHARKRQRSVTLPPEDCQELVQALQQLGVQLRVAELVVAYVQFLILWESHKTVVPVEEYLKHMLPGNLQRSLNVGYSGFPCGLCHVAGYTVGYRGGLHC